MNPNPEKLLDKASKKVPITKYAYAVVGLAAAVAIVSYLTPNPQLAVLGIIGMLGAMVAVILLELAVKQQKKSLRLPALVLLWFFLIFIISTVSVLFSSVFFDKPDLGLKSSLFKKKVELTLERKAGSELVEKLRQLPPDGVEAILETGRKNVQLVGTTTGLGGVKEGYNLPSNYETLKRLANLGLLKWDVSPESFEAMLNRLQLKPDGAVDNRTMRLNSERPLSEEEERQLFETGYSLSNDGEKIFESVVSVVREQIQE